MLINLSNHPSADWLAKQKTAAEKQFGEIRDLPFPVVNPEGDEEYIKSLVNEYIVKIEEIVDQSRNDGCSLPTIHIMGEMTFSFAMVTALQKKGVSCVSSTTERIVKEENGVKTSEFKFVRFRNY
jgi:hypothetical protein